MAFGLGFEIRGTDIAKNASRAAERHPVLGELTMRRLAVEMRSELFKRMSAPTTRLGFWGAGSPEGPFLGVRSGHTRRALTPGRVYKAKDDLIAVVGHPGKHVAALEEGKVIRPVSGSYLRVPTRHAQTPSGVDINLGRSIRDLPGYRLIRSKRGRLWAVQSDEGAPQGFRLMYLLVPSVKMPKKGIFKASKLHMDPRVRELFGIHATQVVRILQAA